MMMRLFTYGAPQKDRQTVVGLKVSYAVMLAWFVILRKTVPAPISYRPDVSFCSVLRYQGWPHVWFNSCFDNLQVVRQVS